jgi:hypothetical protein
LFRHRHIHPRLLLGLGLLVLALHASGCSGSRESGAPIYRAELGRAPTTPLLVNVVASTLQGYGFQIRTFSDNLIVTEWRRQPPTIAENDRGVVRVRDQAQIRITERGSGEAVARLRVVYETSDGEGWADAAPTGTVQRQYEQIQRDIRERLQQFMTQY